MSATVLSIQVGLPKEFLHQGKADNAETTWSSGIYKDTIEGPLFVDSEGVAGDGQADLKHHGGPDRRLLIFSKGHYPYFEEFIGKEIPHGGFGENLTVDNFNEDEVCIGDTYRIGGAVIEVSQPRLPCFKLGRRLDAPEIVSEVLDQRKGGIYARILEPGEIHSGDSIELISRPHPGWTIKHAMDVFLAKGHPRKAELGQLTQLSQLWLDRLNG